MFKLLKENAFLNLHKSFFFVCTIFFYSIVLFLSFLINKNFDEEFVYFFIILLIIIVSLSLFENIFNSLIETRTTFIYSQYLDLYTKNVDFLILLATIERDNLQFFSVFLETFFKFYGKLVYFFKFYLAFFPLRYMSSLFMKKLFHKIALIFQVFLVKFDKNLLLNKKIFYKERVLFFFSTFKKFFSLLKYNKKK